MNKPSSVKAGAHFWNSAARSLRNKKPSPKYGTNGFCNLYVLIHFMHQDLETVPSRSKVSHRLLNIMCDFQLCFSPSLNLFVHGRFQVGNLWNFGSYELRRRNLRSVNFQDFQWSVDPSLVTESLQKPLWKAFKEQRLVVSKQHLGVGMGQPPAEVDCSPDYNVNICIYYTILYIYIIYIYIHTCIIYIYIYT